MLRIVRADISELKADAIVNCASSNPTIGAGVESALFAKGVTRFLSVHEKMDVKLVVYDWKTYTASKHIFGDIDSRLGIDFDAEEAILKSYIDAILPPKRRSSEQVYLAKQKKKLADHRANYLRPISQTEREKALAGLRLQAKMYRKGYALELIRLLKAKHLSPSKIYDKKYLSKQVFCKVRHGKYATTPDKDTLLMIAFRMRLTYGETSKFLAHAGLALSPSNLRDLIIGDFISRGDYQQVALDMVLCNEQLKQLFGTVGE